MPKPSGMYLGLVDFSNEITSTMLYVPTMSALNYAAVVGNRDAIEAAINDVTACNIRASWITVAAESLVDTPPVDPFAQREIGLRVSYQDNVTGAKYGVTIGGARLNLLAQAGTDIVDPASAEWLALVAALNANAVSPDGNAITVTGGRIVGRAS